MPKPLSSIRPKSVQLVFLLICGIALQACSLMGIHLKLHNPKKPGKIPDFTNESILLGELTHYRTCFDVTYYDLSVEISPTTHVLSGKVQIHARATSDFDTLQLDLDQPFAINKLVDQASGKDLEYYRNERAVMVLAKRKKDDQFIIDVEYKGVPVEARRPPWEGGFVWKKDNEGQPWIGVACESEGASIWWPLKDHNSDEPDSMRMHYTVPSNLIAVGNGQFEGKTVNGNQATFNWFVSYPINTYDVTVYVGNFAKFSDVYYGIEGRKLSLDYYVLPYNLDVAKQEFKLVPKVLKSFEESFGSYPWYRDGYKLVEAPFMGMEHQTAIAYGSGYGSRQNHTFTSEDDIIIHETAHEWWGNSVTAKDFADVWLQEGFATYAEAMYAEKKGSLQEKYQLMSLHRIMIQNKIPVVTVSGRRWFHYKKNADVYSKGAWILEELRAQLQNDSLFFDILRSFQLQYRYQVVDSQDFINWVNKKSGKDYSWFFKQYLYKHLVPEFEFTINKNGEMLYRWNKVGDDFNRYRLRIKFGNDQVILQPSTTVQVLDIRGLFKSDVEPQFESSPLVIYKENKKLQKPL